MSTDQPNNYYTILGVAVGASTEMIQEAFAAQRVEFMRQMPDPSQSPQFQQIAYAYEVLSDPDRRALYDSLLVETSPPALRINVQTSRDQIGMSSAAQLIYVLVEAQPPQQQADMRLPLNLCLVLDKSTSMRGERLNRVKTAVELVLEKLGPEDIISVINFSDRAETILPAGHVVDPNQVLGKIRRMTASGGTEIFQGLAAGVAQMKTVSLEHHINHLILLTDGHTYGDAEDCLRLAQSCAADGIGITAFGLGLEWNDQFLDRLVAPSGGQSGYIDEPQRIVAFLQERIQGLGDIYARNIKVILDFPESVSLRYGFRLYPSAQPLSIHAREVQMGDIEGRRHLSFLLELNIEPQPVETRIRLPFRLIADIPGQTATALEFKHDHQLLVLTEAPEVQPPESLLKAVRMLNMYRLNEKVWEDVETGHVNTAETRMRHLSTRFLEAGQTQLAQQAHLEAERLGQLGTLSTEGRKTLKFGTRSLLQQVAEWEESDEV